MKKGFAEIILLTVIALASLAVMGFSIKSQLPQLFGGQPYIRPTQLGPNPVSGNCLTTDGNDGIWSTCGSGGSGGGTWSTTTSSVAGRLINYPNNTTDIVTIGATATSAAKFYFDPNLPASNFTGTTTMASTTLIADGTAGVPGLAFTSDSDTGIRRSGTNSIALTGGSSSLQWDGSSLLGLSSGRHLGSDANPFLDLYVGRSGAGLGNFRIATSSLSEDTLLITNGIYPSAIFGTDDASPIANVEINSQAQGPYSFFGFKNDSSSGAIGIDNSGASIGGLSTNIIIKNNTAGRGVCLETGANSGNFDACIRSYNGLGAIFNVLAPYNASGVEANLSTSIVKANGTDTNTLDIGLEDYPGSTPTGNQMYMHALASSWPVSMPWFGFGFWNQGCGNTSNSSCSWGFFSASSTSSSGGPPGTVGTSSVVCLGDCWVNGYSKGGGVIDYGTRGVADGTGATLQVTSIVGTTTRSKALEVSSRFGNTYTSMLTVSNSGRVGIGTSTPAAMFVVSTSTNQVSNIQIATPGTGSAQQSAIDFITRSDASFLGTANNLGWTITARGNAFTTAGEQNDLITSYWNGSTYITPFSIDSLTGVVSMPYASTTALSATALCLSTDCRTAWPSSGGSGNTTWELNANGHTGFLAPTTTQKVAIDQASSTVLSARYFQVGGTATTTFTQGGFVGIGSTSPFANLSIHANQFDTGSKLFAIGSSTANATTTLLNFSNVGAFDIGSTTSAGFHLGYDDTSSGNGLTLTTTAAGSGLTLTTISQATNESVALTSKGSGNVSVTGGTGGGVLLRPSGTTRYTLTDTSHTFTRNVSSTGSLVRFNYTNAADAAITSSVEAPEVYFNLGNSTRTHAIGAIGLQRDFRITGGVQAFASFNAAGNIISTSSALAIDGPPGVGLNGRQTAAYGVLIGTTTDSTGLNASTTNAYGLGVLAPTGATNNFAAMFMGGNVGIGTTTPASLLSIEGTANFRAATSSFSSTGGIDLASGCFAIRGTCLSGGGGSGTPGGSGTELQYRGGASTFSAVTPSAYSSGTNFLGLGTTTPTALLTLSSSTAPQLIFTDALSTNLGGLAERMINGSFYWATTTGSGATTTTALMFIDAGNIGAQNATTSKPTATTTLNTNFNVMNALTVNNQGSTTISNLVTGKIRFVADAGAVTLADLPISGAANNTEESYSLNIAASTTPNMVVYGQSDGSAGVKNQRIGIGTSTPWRTLSIHGTGAWRGLTAAAGTPSSLCIDPTTKEITENAALTCTVSSKEYKTDMTYLGDTSLVGSVSGVTPMNALEVINKIKPAQFAYKDNPDRLRWGFYAEDLAAVDPKLADAFDQDGHARSIDQNALLAVSIEAIQELDAKMRAFEIAKGLARSAEENAQWLGMLFLLGLIGYQQVQIRRLKK